MSDAQTQASQDATVVNKEGLHARPVMRFVDLACTFKSTVSVTNTSRNGETVDGKSAMQMMLLEATRGCVLRIVACGEDAPIATNALAALIDSGFDASAVQKSD